MYIDAAAPPPAFLGANLQTTAASFLVLDTTQVPKGLGLSTPLYDDRDLSTTPEPMNLDAVDFVHTTGGKSSMNQGSSLQDGARTNLLWLVAPEGLVPEWLEAAEKKFGVGSTNGTLTENLSLSGETCSPFPFCDENGCTPWQLMTLISFELLLLVLIVASNITIISVILDMNKSTRNRSYRSANVFKLSLAVADLLLGLSILPPAIKTSIDLLIREDYHLSIQQVNSIGSPVAIIFGTGALIATIASIWSILAIQIDLFLRMRWPVKQHVGGILNTQRARYATGVIWVLAIGVTFSLFGMNINFGLNQSTLSFSPMINPLDDEGNLNPVRADETYKFLIYAVMVWGLPFLLTIPLGTYLVFLIRAACKKLALRSKASYVRRHPDVVENKHRIRRCWEATLRTITVEVVFFVTFLPSIVAQIVYSQTDGCDSVANMLHFCAAWILCTGSFVNLFVYHLMWKDFQDRMKVLFCMVPKSSPITSIASPRTQRTTLPGDNRNTQVKITLSYDIERKIPV